MRGSLTHPTPPKVLRGATPVPGGAVLTRRAFLVHGWGFDRAGLPHKTLCFRWVEWAWLANHVKKC